MVSSIFANHCPTMIQSNARKSVRDILDKQQRYMLDDLPSVAVGNDDSIAT